MKGTQRSNSVGRNTLRPAQRRSTSRSKTRPGSEYIAVRLPARTKNGEEQLLREWEAAGGKGAPPDIGDNSRKSYPPKDETLSWKPTQVARWLKEIGMQDSVFSCQQQPRLKIWPRRCGSVLQHSVSMARQWTISSPHATTSHCSS